MNRQANTVCLSGSLPIFVKALYRTVIRFFALFGKQAPWSLAQAAVIRDTFAAFSVIRAGSAGAGAFDRILAGHSIPLVSKCFIVV